MRLSLCQGGRDQRKTSSVALKKSDARMLRAWGAVNFTGDKVVAPRSTMLTSVG